MDRNCELMPVSVADLMLAVELSQAGKPLWAEVGDSGGKVPLLDESHTACPLTIKRFPPL